MTVSFAQLNKHRIARQFSRAANTYDSAAEVQLDIAQDAMSLLPKQANRVLDIGCGTGRISQKLAAKYQQVWAMDLAFGMLSYAKQQALMLNPNIVWMQGDAEHLPIADQSVDLVFSSMALQWCNQQNQVMQEVKRVLSKEGQAVLAIMCDGSFTELNQSWQQIDSQRHTNLFASAGAWLQAAQSQGLQVQMQQSSYMTWHSGVRPLLSSIKSIGANVLIGAEAGQEPQQNKSLTRLNLQQLENHYQQHFAQGAQLPLTYQVCFLVCQHN
ncbi:malonyl-ACP O-methyltransferase BioC [Paraglaciecola aestuariivivens]